MRLTFCLFNWRPIKVNLGVDNKKRIVGVNDIVVYTDTIQILFQKTLEEHVFFLESSLLLLNGKLVEEDFVVSFVEIIEKLEFIVLVLFNTFDFFNIDIRNFFKCDFITLIERQDFLLFGFELSAKFRSL